VLFSTLTKKNKKNLVNGCSKHPHFCDFRTCPAQSSPPPPREKLIIEYISQTSSLYQIKQKKNVPHRTCSHAVSKITPSRRKFCMPPLAVPFHPNVVHRIPALRSDIFGRSWAGAGGRGGDWRSIGPMHRLRLIRQHNQDENRLTFIGCVCVCFRPL